MKADNINEANLHSPLVASRYYVGPSVQRRREHVGEDIRGDFVRGLGKRTQSPCHYRSLIHG